jgi:hypothetical protein
LEDFVLTIGETENIQQKSLWGFQDVDNEVDLILARASIFERSENIHSFSICPFHRLTLRIGWKRSGTRCSVPQQLSGHNKRKFPKGDRGISKLLSRQIWKHTGILIPVGSGKGRTIRYLRGGLGNNQKKIRAQKKSRKKYRAQQTY